EVKPKTRDFPVERKCLLGKALRLAEACFPRLPVEGVAIFSGKTQAPVARGINPACRQAWRRRAAIGNRKSNGPMLITGAETRSRTHHRIGMRRGQKGG
ncbi:MAG: hypothetical protein WBC59_02650, partial [Phycisphaerae bacterium]